MENVQVQDPPTSASTLTPTAPASAQSPATSADPFSFDQNAYSSLTPEQRASFEPTVQQWKTRAQEEISKREAAAAEKYRPVQERADALDKLTKYQPFISWWSEQQKSAQQQNPANAGQIAQSQPQTHATPAEWSEAVLEASNGNADKLQAIQARMMAAWATPLVRQITEKQQAFETQMGLRDLFEKYPDAKELDSVGIDPKTKSGVSLLEQALDWAERNGRGMEEGYQLARKWADQFQVSAQQKAMGIVQSKKAEVTAGPSTTTTNPNVIQVDTVDELLRRNMEAQLSGQKDVRFVLKK